MDAELADATRVCGGQQGAAATTECERRMHNKRLDLHHRSGQAAQSHARQWTMNLNGYLILQKLYWTCDVFGAESTNYEVKQTVRNVLDCFGCHDLICHILFGSIVYVLQHSETLNKEQTVCFLSWPHPPPRNTRIAALGRLSLLLGALQNEVYLPNSG